MCFDLLNPIKICEFACALLFGALVFVVGGYVGKWIYLYSGTSTTFWQTIQNPQFYTLDSTFWACGFVLMFLIFTVLVLVRAIFIGASKLVEYLCCRFCCTCRCLCCRDIAYDRKKEVEKMERYRKSAIPLYEEHIKMSDIENGNYDDGEDDEEEYRHRVYDSSRQKKKNEGYLYYSSQKGKR